MGLIIDLLNAIGDMAETNNKEKNERLEKKMDAYDLEDWQKELVRKGEYDPENFEDDDDDNLEDDDYYYEDDDE